MDDASGVVLFGDLSQFFTLAHFGIVVGIFVGTVSYMVFEQACGKFVDKRVDIWVFGVLLWEMLTGRCAFGGEIVSDVLAAVLTTTLDLETLPAGTPRVRRLLERCLRKDPKRACTTSPTLGSSCWRRKAWRSWPPGPPPRLARRLLPWAVAALTIAASLGGRSSADGGGALARPLALAVLPPSGMVSTGPIDLSVDGRQLAFTAAGAEGQSRLYVCSLDSLEATTLPGTENADAPFLSPNGRSISFFAKKKLKRIDLAGGRRAQLADASEHRGAAGARRA
jgi:serine/threonine-protein kinase